MAKRYSPDFFKLYSKIINYMREHSKHMRGIMNCVMVFTILRSYACKFNGNINIFLIKKHSAFNVLIASAYLISKDICF